MINITEARAIEQNRRNKKRVSKPRFIIKRLLVWFLISIVLQVGGLYYVSYWLTGHSQDKVTVISGKKKIKDKETFNIKSVGDIASYSVSYDAKYIAFVDDEGLKVFNAKTKQITNLSKSKEPAHEARTNREVTYPSGAVLKVSYLKWLPDRNKLMYALEWESYKNGPVNIDINITDISGTMKTRMAHFGGRAKGTVVKNIAVSTLTNLIYIQLETPYKTAELYQVDIMSSMTRLAGTDKMLGKIAASPKDGTLYAEIYTKKNEPPKISVIKDSSIFDLYSGNDRYRLLGVDNNGKAYLGEESAGMITGIYTVSVEKETKERIDYVRDPEAESTKKKVVSYVTVTPKDLNKVLYMDTSVQPDKIYIMGNGDVIIDNSPDTDSVSLYQDGNEKKKTDIAYGKKEILSYNKYAAVLIKGKNPDESEITIYNLDVNSD